MCARKLHYLFPAVLVLLLLASCTHREAPPAADHPRLTPDVIMRDISFHSTALNRDMLYRVALPKNIAPGAKLPVVYLLHGGGGDYREWSNDSDVACFAEQGLVLVMPEGGSSYYTNSRTRPEDRYEDYIVGDLIHDVESRFPVAADRSHRAAIGVSMGGFGAVKIALKHPELFAFVGGLSSALDVPTRLFSIKRLSQWRGHRAIFGPWNGEVQKQNDPYTLARTADPAVSPYFYLTCGDQEGLLPANRQFAALLGKRHFAFEFHETHGGHNWNQWNPQLEACFRSLREHLAN
jgi:S-formylglutathione hydrolase FrmB